MDKALLAMNATAALQRAVVGVTLQVILVLRRGNQRQEPNKLFKRCLSCQSCGKMETGLTSLCAVQLRSAGALNSPKALGFPEGLALNSQLYSLLTTQIP